MAKVPVSLSIKDGALVLVDVDGTEVLRLPVTQEKLDLPSSVVTMDGGQLRGLPDPAEASEGDVLALVDGDAAWQAPAGGGGGLQPGAIITAPTGAHQCLAGRVAYNANGSGPVTFDAPVGASDGDEFGVVAFEGAILSVVQSEDDTLQCTDGSFSGAVDVSAIVAGKAYFAHYRYVTAESKWYITAVNASIAVD